jgi:YD repeat-containing protein
VGSISGCTIGGDKGHRNLSPNTVTTTFTDGRTSQAVYHGLVTTTTNSLNQTRTVTRDNDGQGVSVTNAVSKTTSFAYDPFGKLIRTTDASGNFVTRPNGRSDVAGWLLEKGAAHGKKGV